MNVMTPLAIITPQVAEARLVSVLMSTYARETSARLAVALESVFVQTLPPHQLVLVVDGPVGRDQEAVIEQYRHDQRILVVDVVRLPNNQGLATALNAGLEVCQGEWIMRMDSDDICSPDRLAIQLSCVDRFPDVDIFSSWCEEFSDDDDRRKIKASAIEHDAVVNTLRWRNALVHPSNLIRATTLRQLGGYRGKYGRLEDYDLYVRMALAGARFRVIPTELLQMRVDRAFVVRRGGWRYMMGEIRFRIFCWRSGFLTTWQFLLITSAYMLFRVGGAGMRGFLYRFVRV